MKEQGGEQAINMDKNLSSETSNDPIMWLLLVLFLSLAFGVSFFGFSEGWARSGSLETWKQVDGALMDHDIGTYRAKGKRTSYYWPELEYVYLVDDVLYSGWVYSPKEFSSESKKSIETIISRLASKPLKVFVCPDEPRLSALVAEGIPIRGFVLGRLIVPLGTGFALLFSIVLYWIKATRTLTTHKYWLCLVLLITISIGLIGAWCFSSTQTNKSEILLETGGAAEFQRLLSEQAPSPLEGAAITEPLPAP